MALHDQSYSEETYLRDLGNGYHASHTQFTIRWMQKNTFEWNNYNLFPRFVGELVNEYNVDELEVSLGKGFWRKKWGEPFGRGLYPNGASVRAWIKNTKIDAGHGEETSWTLLNRALAGMLCGSFNEINEVQNSVNMIKFGNDMYHKQGYLSREAVCTENLTPWLKLLPCRSKAGHAQAWGEPSEIFRNEYHSFGMHFRRFCTKSSDSKPRVPGGDQKGNPVWSTGHCKDNEFGVELVFSATFVNKGKPFLPKPLGACPLADISKLYVEKNSENVEIEPVPDFMLALSQDVVLGVYDLKERNRLDSINLKGGVGETQASSPYLVVSSGLSDSGGLRGGVSTLLKNEDSSQSLRVNFLEVFPAFQRVYLHTLNVTVSGLSVSSGVLYNDPSFHFLPGNTQKGTCTKLEFSLNIPPNSEAHVYIEFEKFLMRLDEYPPDPNRGQDMPAVKVTYTIPGRAEDKLSRANMPNTPLFSRWPVPGEKVAVYANGLLVSMPLPDFSMPYNVITLTCTIVAFFFGSTHNLLVRRRDEEKNKKKNNTKKKKCSIM